MKLQKLKHFLGAAIVITTPCTNNLEVKAMTNESSQEAIKVIYQDEFFSRPENRHRRDRREIQQKLLILGQNMRRISMASFLIYN